MPLRRPFRIRLAVWGMVEAWRRKLLLSCRWSRVQLFTLMSKWEGLWVNCRSSCCGVSLEETRCNRSPSCLRARRTFPSCFHASSPLRHRRGMKAERGRRGPQTAWLSKFPVILCEVKGQLTASGKRCSGDSRSSDVLCLSLLLREGEGQEPGWVKRSEVN